MSLQQVCYRSSLFRTPVRATETKQSLWEVVVS